MTRFVAVNTPADAARVIKMIVGGEVRILGERQRYCPACWKPLARRRDARGRWAESGWNWRKRKTCGRSCAGKMQGRR